MDTLQCAVGLGKLGRFEWEVSQRLKMGALYSKLLKDNVRVVAQRHDRTSVFAQYTVFVDERDSIREKLASDDIPTAVHYPVPLHLQPAYTGKVKVSGRLVSSEGLANKVLSLPMSPDISEESIGFISQKLISALR